MEAETEYFKYKIRRQSDGSYVILSIYKPNPIKVDIERHYDTYDEALEGLDDLLSPYDQTQMDILKKIIKNDYN